MAMTGLGAFIEKYLEDNSMRASELAIRTGLSAALISKLIRNQTSPNLRTLMKLSAALGVRVADLAQSYQDGEEQQLFNRIRDVAENEVSWILHAQGETIIDKVGQEHSFDAKRKLYDFLKAIAATDGKPGGGGGVSKETA